MIDPEIIISNIERNLSNMSEDQRREYLEGMGFVLKPNVSKQKKYSRKMYRRVHIV